MGEAREDGDGDDLGVLLHLRRRVVEPAHRSARGALAAEGRQDRRLAHGRRGAEALADHIEQPLRRLHSALAHVHVRIGLVPVEEIGAADHARAQVAVEIEGNRDGHLGPDHAPHGLDEIALAVIEPLGNHGPVEIEEHAVDGARGLQVAEHALLHVLVDVPGDEARGGSGRRHRGDEAGAATLGRRDHPAQTGAGAAEGLDDLAAVVEITRFELAAVGGDVAEGVGLVGHHGQELSHRGLLYDHFLRGATLPIKEPTMADRGHFHNLNQCRSSTARAARHLFSTAQFCGPMRRVQMRGGEGGVARGVLSVR